MSEVQRILQHYENVLNGEPWYGDPIWQILEGIAPQTAAAPNPSGGHTIWEILMHTTFWEEVAAQRLVGERAGLVAEKNFLATPQPTPSNWSRTLDEFRRSNQKLREAIAKLEVARLDESTAAGKRSFYAEAHGAIEHDIYHAGQVALLRKVQAAS